MIMSDFGKVMRKVGRAVAGSMESQARLRARENRNSPLGQEYENWVEGMRNFKNSPILNSDDDDEE